MENLHGRMAALLAVLRAEMNGPVADAIAEGGYDYPFNYGVSVPVIRRAAAGFAPDAELAEFLWRRPVRELRIAACYIADPQRFTADDAERWMASAANAEVASHLAVLLSRTGLADGTVGRWSGEGNDPLRVYCALLWAALARDAGHIALSDGELRAMVGRWKDSPNALVRSAADALSVRLG